jgi:hypothetical protein
MNSRQIICSVCSKSSPTTTAFSRWGSDFCSIECVKQRLAIEEKITQEKEEKKEKTQPNPRWFSHDIGGGGAY